MAMRQEPIGLIGLGLMGQALATRLIPAGFRVVGYDIDTAKNARLKALGGESAESLAEAAKCGTLVLAVFSTDQVEQVAQQTTCARRGKCKIVLRASTCDPDWIVALAACVAGRKAPAFSKPRSPAAAAGQPRRGHWPYGGYLKMAGGGRRHSATAPSPASSSTSARLQRRRSRQPAINLILGLNRMALAEGLASASRLGLDARPSSRW